MKNLILYAKKFQKLNSLIHIGGYKGQEIDYYKSLNLDRVIIFEPIDEFADEIENKIRDFHKFTLHRCALGNQNSEQLIYIADKGKDDDSGSTSLKEPKNSNFVYFIKKSIKKLFKKKYLNFAFEIEILLKNLLFIYKASP